MTDTTANCYQTMPSGNHVRARDKPVGRRRARPSWAARSGRPNEKALDLIFGTSTQMERGLGLWIMEPNVFGSGRALETLTDENG